MSIPSRVIKSKSRRFAPVWGLLVIGFALSGCSSAELPALGFPRNVTDINDRSLNLWQGAWIAAFIVGGFTALLILYAALKFRRKDESLPVQTRYHLPVEIVWTVIPFLIVAVLFYFTARDESAIIKISPSSVAMHEIKVNGIQWSWQFSYKDASDATVTGTPKAPPTLYIPQGERVRLTLTASDVVHGFWVPAFMMQMQNLPGVQNQFEFTANKLGSYPGRCNILCGRNHSQMLFTVKVVTPVEYQNYLNSLKGSAA
jgi:cytochrome c oxidase subunit 2